jgi:hypothetical protein
MEKESEKENEKNFSSTLAYFSRVNYKYLFLCEFFEFY